MELGELWESETLLWQAFARGTVVDRGGVDPLAAETRPEDWGKDRQVRAEVIGLLLRGAAPVEPGYTAKVQLIGAKVVGELDLNGARVEAELLLDQCWVDEKIDLTDARMRAVTLTSSRLTMLQCERLVVDGPLNLSGSTAASLTLAGGHVTGSLSLNGTLLTNGDGDALEGNNLAVDQDMVCSDGFHAVGALRLTGAHIGGVLILSGASLTNPAGDALHGDGIIVDQDVFCRGGFSAEGAVRLLGAHIGGQLILDGSSLINPDGDALLGDNLTVDQSMHCSDGFRAEGVLRLGGAHIGGQLVLGGASLTNPDGAAMAADGLTVDHDMFCTHGFSALGELALSGAHIGGVLNLNGASLANPGGDALVADDLTVGQALYCSDGLTVNGGISLRGARVAGLLDLSGDGLALACFDGLHFGGIAPQEATDKLLRWLATDPHGFHAQPYEQLANYLRGLGQDRAARKVLLAKQRAHRHSVRVWRRPVGWLLDVLSGYGYAPGRSLLLLLIAIAAGWLYFRTYGLPPTVNAAGTAFSGWYNLFYVTDVVIPTSAFGQEAKFAPTGADLGVVAALQTFGWLLSIALIPAVTRTLSRT